MQSDSLWNVPIFLQGTEDDALPYCESLLLSQE